MSADPVTFVELPNRVPYEFHAFLVNETRIAKLEALLLNKDGLNSGSETSSSAMKDQRSKLDAVSAKFVAGKEKNKKLIMENEKLQYRITHLIRAIKEADSS